MAISPALRRFALTAHVTFSVGWIGAVIAYLALAVAGLATTDLERARAAYVSMELVGWFVIVPFSVAGLASGVVESFATEWGFFRYHWVQTKLAVTVVATAMLFTHMSAVRRMATLARHASELVGGDVGSLRVQLVVHAIGGLIVLLTAVWLSIYKPWGRTAYGERVAVRGPSAKRARPFPRRALVIAIAIVVLVVIAMLHLHGGAPRHH